jgi:hypothetical protein
MTTKIVVDLAGAEIAEDKEYARGLRMRKVLPALEAGDDLEIDFSAALYATQSFVHALLGEALKRHGEPVLERIEFKNCSKQLRDIIELVVDYSLGGFESISSEKRVTRNDRSPRRRARR